MRSFFEEASRVVADEGHLVLLFNARERESWTAIRVIIDPSGTPGVAIRRLLSVQLLLESVVQDNRKGAMKSDWARFFAQHARVPTEDFIGPQ